MPKPFPFYILRHPEHCRCIPFSNHSELERQANIARNKALLEELELADAVDNVGFTKKPPPPPPKAKPPKPKPKRVNPEKRGVVEDTGPRRQSARLKRFAEDPDESPEKKRKRLVCTLARPVGEARRFTLGNLP